MNKKLDAGFLAAGSVMTIIFIIIVNFLTNASYPWFIYPVFALLFSAAGLIFGKRGKYFQLSLFGSLLLLIFFIAVNYIHTPDYPWFLFVLGPIALWPVLVFLGYKAKDLNTALIGSLSIIFYYFILNILLSPQYIWAIYIAFPVLWWPLAVYHVKKKTYFSFSVHASLLISLFFIIVNFINSPQIIWAVYPIFAVLWWPLSMYYFYYKRR
ncbi:hypothetical protein [Niallia sp. NCCP-28]|uniref:hypothetical protein n=1 Tax=Niallia sp. NCCP-28 TaxID=2934712 RepID=UPI00207E71AD|nr:hypothetical protein [Niallia sp. NCCP-28]GKU81916.1 hypothetical protein NCCP28_13120 [Niallia sp. NCCP-28]